MNRLWLQLSLAFLIVTLLGVGLVALFAGIRTDRDFRRFLQEQQAEELQDLAAQLGAYYETNASWRGIEITRAPGMMGGMRRTRVHPGNQISIADTNGRVVYDANARNVGATVPAAALAQGIPITAHAQTVGYIIYRPPPDVDMMLQNSAQNFLAQLRGTLWMAGLVAGALSIVLGIVLSRTLTAPLAQLAQAAHRFAARDWSQRVQVRGAQEIAEVSTAFNQMADELQRQEIARRSMIADIAHELRTPLTVMQGNLRAMLDEVYPLERGEIATLYDETRLLARLVDDLRELALADAGQLPLTITRINLREILENAAQNFSIAADAQNVQVESSQLESLPVVRADGDRVAQVLRNLLANALRHTPEGGTISLEAQPREKFVRVIVHDTGEGIAPEDLPHVFERFYRADISRARASGGTGLGLAIAKAWIEAMGGKIGVASEMGKGSTFWFDLPRA